MESIIKKIEDMSLNAWPSHKMELYDGWILRFSYFYTHRTNSVEQFSKSTLPWREKIPYCEQVYKRLGTPAIFKISPLVSPDFDYMLENRGYQIEHVTNVMTVELCPSPTAHVEKLFQNVAISNDLLEASTPKKDINTTSLLGRNKLCEYPDVTFSNTISDVWIESLFNLKNTTNLVHREVVPSMYHSILKETICASIEKDGQIIGTGLGILDREYVGIYAIHVRDDYRGKGYARQIVSGLLQEGIKRGASKAYLQVVDGNLPARKLYESLGFTFSYSYWFRVKEISD
ncbi:MAG: GNAT family N-acetyltransferase [Eubacteriales bacterium]|nr:GNAT family N-acetyltransferase [Eubacteriales bacterium]